MTGELRLKRPIVPIEEWLSSPYYLGREAEFVYPFWRQKIIDFYNSDDIRFILSGSYSLGKTHIALIMMLRAVYEATCVEEFPVLFGLSPSSKIKMAFVSVSATKAKKSGIGKLLRLFDQIPYFQQYAPRDLDNNSTLDLGFLEVIYGSNVSHLISDDLYGVLFDEANFVNAAAGEEYNTAKELYLEAQIRGKSRFSINGVQWGFYGLLSSAQDATSFTEQEIKRGRETGDVFIIEAATYDVKPQAYSAHRFPVFLGYEEIPPTIVEDFTDEQKVLIAKNYGQTFEQFLDYHKDLVIQVPVDLKRYYKTDIRYALKSLSGKVTQGSSKLLKNPALLDQAYKDNGLKNPLLVEVPTLSMFQDDDIKDYIDEEVLKANYEPGCKVYIHLDLAVSGDKAGFGACYKSEATGKIRELLDVGITKRQESDEIDLSKIEDIIYWMDDELEMDIGFISYDWAFSKYMSQNLVKRYGKGKLEHLSLDTDDSQYLLFLYLLKKHVVEMYYYKLFDLNFRELNHDKASMKVDHDKEHEKDICDSFIGCAYTCFGHEGLSREEIVASQLQAGEDPSDHFYDDLIPQGDDTGYYGDILANLD